jgi:putative membrane protein
VLALESRLLFEEAIVVGPVLAETARAARRLVSGPRQVMRGQGEILEDEADASGVRLEQLIQRPLDALAVRSLIVGELDDGDGRARSALRHGRLHGQAQIVRRPHGAGGGEEENDHGVHSQEARRAAGHTEAQVHERQDTTRRRDRATGGGMRLLLRVLINTAALLLAAHVVTGVEVRSLPVALAAGLVLGLINAVVRPVLVFLTFPLTLLTLGLFLLALNAFCVWLTSALVPGFTVQGVWPALLTALIVSAVSWVLSAFFTTAHR